MFGFVECIDLLADYVVVCIDEFELDDPGNTTLISRLLSQLVERGVSVAATSNTLPEQLGEGRFAAQDFLREINTLASIFTTVRIEGPDYRHRDLPPAPEPLTDERGRRRAPPQAPGATLDDFDALCAHLATMHPSRYLTLIEGVTAVFITGVHPIDDQNVALRLVSLTDRLYDAGIPVVASGTKLDTDLQRRDAGGRVPQEVPAGDVAAAGADRRRLTRTFLTARKFLEFSSGKERSATTAGAPSRSRSRCRRRAERSWCR